MKLPTYDEMHKLHKNYAPTTEAFESVWEHSDIVRQIAEGIARRRIGIDVELVIVGALLHDIGVYQLYRGAVIDEKNYIKHGLLGYELLEEAGFDEVLCRFALLHTGVGITKADIKANRLALPSSDYVAETQEEKIVMYADKFHSKTRPPVFNSANWYKNHLRRNFGETKVSIFTSLINEFGEPDIGALAAKYEQHIR